MVLKASTTTLPSTYGCYFIYSWIYERKILYATIKIQVIIRHSSALINFVTLNFKMRYNIIYTR